MNDLIWANWLIMAASFAVLIWLGWRSSRIVHHDGEAGFLVAGRSLGPLVGETGGPGLMQHAPALKIETPWA